jgi:hypothetical protein
MRLLHLALFLLAPLPAAAQEAQADRRADTGAVAQALFAQDLLDLGLARKDPAAVLAAARLAAGISATDTDRIPDPPGDAVPPTHPDADFMFTAARALSQQDDLLTDLVARTAAERPGLPTRSVIRSSRGIAGGAAQVYQLPFFADAMAEVGLLGDGKGNLDLSVTTADGTPVCLDSAPGDRALCTFTPSENAGFQITVTNRSETAASYSLLTN